MKKQKYYKAFDKDLKCRDMQYEIDKEFEFSGNPIPCVQGFHYCKSIADCYRFYSTTENTRICEVEPLGDIATNDNIKYCTNKIKIVAEVKNPRLKSNLSESSSGYCNIGKCNSGDWNCGNCNTGDCNSGYKNSGDFNSGNHNTGDCNSGNYNSGNCNSGDCNSGNCNIGDYNGGYKNSGNCNSGNYNSGNHNSGDWNCGNYNSGLFNTSKKPTIKMFDKESNWTIADWYDSKAYSVMKACPCSYSNFISESNMTTEEKERHPEYQTISGYVKVFIATTKHKQKWWDSLSESDKQSVYCLPNFDADKFRKCTGIEIKTEVDNGNDY